MRILVLLRGLPASGKSSFVTEHHLSDYTVSSDVLRTMLGSNSITLDGKYSINQSVGSTMWGVLYDILERRFDIGALTVLDATNIKSADISKAYKLAKSYRYRVYCVDFSDVPVDTCIKRDSHRPQSKQVGKSVILRMASSLRDNKVPGGIQVIKPDEWESIIQYRAVDLSNYTRVHHIGDIHGCHTALQNYLKGGLNPTEFYIFIGDYIDRGIENVEMIDFVASVCDSPNVILLEGNHEKRLTEYVAGIPSKTLEFEEKTRVQLDSANPESMQKKCKTILSKLRQCFVYTWNGKTVLCTHGGLSKFPGNLSFINTEQLISGVGVYRDMIAVNNTFAEQNWDKNIYQVHGHRNVEQVPIEVNNCCFNLCCHIEYGGNLRCLTLDSDGFHPITTPNPVYRKVTDDHFVTVSDMKEVMKASPYVKVVPQGDTGISSYNFTRDAFSAGVWDGITTKARGLFLRDETNEIVARGYDKFFAIDERSETNIDVLMNTLQYPVSAYKKENGFLGICGFDKVSDSLVFCSKSEVNGVYSNYFKKLLLSVIDEKALYQYMKPQNVTLLFEVVDIENDPHIITYDKSQVYLLDIVENSVLYRNYPYAQTKETAELLGLKCKELSAVLHNKEEFLAFHAEISKDDYKWQNRFIEGFVFVDSRGFMFKFKCEYYKYWKFLRGQVEKMRGGTLPKIEHPFLKWVAEDKNRCNMDIISLRNLYTKRGK